MVQNIVVLGTQWGDEGKGKVVDIFTSDVKYVVRYQGGRNAGHTITVDDKSVVLHLIPSGILYDHVFNVIASGVVLSPISFIKEIEKLKELNILVNNRIFISESCSLVLPYHVAVDIAREQQAKISIDKTMIGTTGCGIGPAYEDRVARRSLRISDLYDRDSFEKKLKNIADYYNFQLAQYYRQESINYKVVMDEIISISGVLMDMIVDVPSLLLNARKKGDRVIFEGSQGCLLDINHGTYPYVTSANTVSGGVSIGSGIGPSYVDYIFGVMKAYITRVGCGPFPTELLDDVIESWLCNRGNEFGSTTGRRRRSGWFDAVAVRHSIQVSSIMSVCLTKIDILDGLEQVKICIAYKLRSGELIYNFPYTMEKFDTVIPVYEVLPGWPDKATAGIRNFDQLPIEARCYIKRIEEVIGIPIDIISTGPERSANIILRNPMNIESKI